VEISLFIKPGLSSLSQILYLNSLLIQVSGGIGTYLEVYNQLPKLDVLIWTLSGFL
jgi:hypothetical protein